jgi:hypothetical protein
MVKNKMTVINEQTFVKAPRLAKAHKTSLVRLIWSVKERVDDESITADDYSYLMGVIGAGKRFGNTMGYISDEENLKLNKATEDIFLRYQKLHQKRRQV